MKRTGFKPRKSPIRKVSARRRQRHQSPEGKLARAYMLMVKQLPCCICGAPPPSDAHHAICGRYSTAKSSDWDTLPLCKRHHQDGSEAIHAGKESWVAKHGPDTDYIPATRAAVVAMGGPECPE